ncbi:MAG: hypothetical protein KatS3mg122_2837 [Caldimonas sp.]|nr:MAG: hypothetical protein KatS3mg122_2837 [Caldimonas sp.]
MFRGLLLLRIALAALLLHSLSGVASELSPWAGASGAAPAPPWHFVGLPGQTLPRTRYSLVEMDGVSSLRIEAQASYGNFVHPVKSRPGHLSWSWRVARFAEHTDLRTKAGDDTSVKVCALFDHALERVPFFERQLLRMARARSGSDLPAATLCYVWDTDLAAGTVIDNAYSRRVRYLVLRSGEAAPTPWRRESRDLAADFLRAFHDEATDVPRLLAIAVGADTDNTGSQAIAFVRDLQHRPGGSE